MKKLSFKRLQRNTGEQLTTLYGCSSLRLPKGEQVISRNDFGPDNSVPSAFAGWNSQRIETSKRTIEVVSNYMNGNCTVTEV